MQVRIARPTRGSRVAECTFIGNAIPSLERVIKMGRKKHVLSNTTTYKLECFLTTAKCANCFASKQEFS